MRRNGATHPKLLNRRECAETGLRRKGATHPKLLNRRELGESKTQRSVERMHHSLMEEIDVLVVTDKNTGESALTRRRCQDLGICPDSRANSCMTGRKSASITASTVACGGPFCAVPTLPNSSSASSAA
jgi:hypothetical protein